MKRANGTGCVTKLSGNRRKPWYAKITLGYDGFGKLQVKILSDKDGNKYFENRDIPDLLLANYNIEKGYIKIDKSDYTFSQVYEEFKSKYFPTKEEAQIEKETHKKAKGKLGLSTASGLQSTYNNCTSLYDRLYKSLRKDDFEKIILSVNGSATKVGNYGKLFKKLDNYALEQDIIIKGYAELIKITNDFSNPIKNTGTPYSYDEINEIHKDSGELVPDIILTTIYAGMRIEEVFITKTENVNLEEGYLISGVKTSAGKSRIIPIHHELLPILKKHYNSDNEYLFEYNGKRLYYGLFKPMYDEYINNLGFGKHTTHDGRKTLHSELDRVGANKTCVDKIFGHKSGDIGEDVYTKKSLEELKETIELVDYRSKINTKLTYLRIPS